MKSKVIIIDDQRSILESMETFFRLRDWEVSTATDGLEGLTIAEEVRPSLVILDIRLPGMSGLEVLERLRAKFSDLQVVMITAFQSMESTIQAIKLGAFDYLHKPIDITELDSVIQRLEQVSILDRHSEEYPGDEETNPEDGHLQIIARSRGMKEVFKTIALVSESRVNVLIQGESGTGKEL
ncbi:MAG: sigma-54-dependent transcriptional regulator, partial [Desulfomonilaceae bacterium]